MAFAGFLRVEACILLATLHESFTAPWTAKSDFSVFQGKSTGPPTATPAHPP